MATTNPTISTGAYVEIAVGPIDSISIQCLGGVIEYRIGTSLPAMWDAGHVIRPDNGHTIELSSGDSIYARAKGSASASAAITQ